MRHHLGIGKHEARERALDLLDQVRIPNPRAALGSYPHQFSGGMRQRIQIAIALACDPELLIADEPTTALDVTIQAGILRLLDRLCSERGLAVLLITHDLGILSAIAGRVLVMYSGRVIESSATGELMTGSRHPYTRALLSSVPDPGAAACLPRPDCGYPPSPGRPAARLRVRHRGASSPSRPARPRCPRSALVGRATTAPVPSTLSWLVTADDRTRTHRRRGDVPARRTARRCAPWRG